MKIKTVKYIIPILILTLVLTQISLSYATIITCAFDSDSTSLGNGALNSNAVNSTQVHGLAEVFVCNTTGLLENASLLLRKVGTPTGDIQVYLANVSGTVSVDAAPAYALTSATSALDVATLSTGYAWINFTFDPIMIYADSVYAICLEAGILTDPATIDSANRLEWSYGIAPAGQQGNMAHNQAVVYPFQNWHFLNTNDYEMIVYVDADYMGGGTPTPVPSSVPGSSGYVNYLIEQLIDFFIPLVIMLIPAFLLGFVCRMGKWGYLIGLAIGAGLGYTFIPGFPVWLIFLVSLGIIGFAYSEVKRGG